MAIIANKYKLVAGSGDGAAELTAFDRALQSAGAGDYNLVKVTSILPPGAISGKLATIQIGAVLFAALGSCMSSKNNEMISSAAAIGFPSDRTKPGVIMEGTHAGSSAEIEQRVRE